MKKRKINYERLTYTTLITVMLIIILTLLSELLTCKNELAICKNELAQTNSYTPAVKIKANEYIPIADIITTEEQVISLGEFKLTGYCACEKCCGVYADGITASGTIATEGRTIAVDPNVIPLGTTVRINGVDYIAEDTGSAINEKRIDIYKDSHSACFSSDCNGYAEVYIVR